MASEAVELTKKAPPVTIVVDGREVTARPNEVVIAAAERAGVFIPRFCYHPRLKSPAMCRMCIVEVKGPRGFALQPACYVPVADGMEVVTQSEKVKKVQDGVLEFLLINHPLDCPVCDRGGWCPLQDHTMAFGPGESRFVEEKRHWEKPIWLSDLVHMDRERCIQCARCTRFADDVAGDPLIEFVGRGDRTEVNTFPGEPFSSYFSGNTVQICPVGALLATPYRFKARPWDLESVESTCTTCAVGCRTAVESSTNTLVRYNGVDSDPVNHGWLCDKGRYSFEWVNSASRLTAPMVKKGGELVEASWGEALDAAAEGLERARAGGPSGMAVLGGARLPNEDAYAWAKLAKSVLGTDSVDAQMGDGLPAEVVLGLPRATIDEAASASAVVLLCSDLKEELPVLYLRLRAPATDAGLPIVELSPQGTGMTRHCAASLGYTPGEAAEVARALVAGADPKRDVGGVPAAALRTAREALAGDGPVVVVLGRPSLAEPADAVVEAAVALRDGLGDRVRFLPALRRANVHGAIDMGLAPGVLPGRVGLDEARDWFAQEWGVLPEERGLDAAGVLAAGAEGRLGGLVLLGADPARDFPDRQLARRGLEGAGFTVAVDCFLTESARQADVVLPAAAYAERPGTTTNLEGRVSRLGQKVTPPGVAWPDWMIAVELAAAMGADLGFESLDDVWAEVERLAPSHHGVTQGLLAKEKDGVVAPLRAEPEPDPALTAPGAVAQSTDTAADVATDVAAADAEGGYPDQSEGAAASTGAVDAGSDPGTPGQTEGGAPLGTGRPGALVYDAPSSGGPLPKRDSYSLRLVSARTLYDGGVLAQQSPSLGHLAPAPALRVNPAFLEPLGVASGDRMRVRSNRATLVLPVVADARVPRGSASLGFNLADADGLGAADLIDASAPVTELRLETL